MTTLKTLILSSIAALGIIGGTVAYADRGGERGDPAERSERMIERVSEKLDLDEGQRSNLTLLQEQMAQMRNMMRGEDDMREQLKALISAETFDQAAALDMINQRAQAMQSQAPELVSAAAVFLDSLSAEQKAQIEAFADKRGKHMRRH